MFIPINFHDNDFVTSLAQIMGRQTFTGSRPKSVFFTTRQNETSGMANTNLPDESFCVFFQDYKITGATTEPMLPGDGALDSAVSVAQFQLWSDLTGEHLVEGTGFFSDSGAYFVLSGASITVSQNSSGTVPSAETFVPAGDPFLAWYSESGGSIQYLLPYKGKVWFGYLTNMAEGSDTGDNIRVLVIKPDGTWHSMNLERGVNPNLAFFTHLYSGQPNGEVFFQGVEFDCPADTLPEEEFVAPDVTYVLDEE